MKIGFIGLGAMGEPMARNLHRAGLLSAVYNRTAEKAAAFAEPLDLRAAPDIETLAHACDTVFLCVSADADVLEVVEALAGNLAQDSVVLDCSTVSAETARQAAAKLRETGVYFLDCPVSGGTEGAREATLAIMVGGDQAAFERTLPVLELLGKRVVHMGLPGAGQATKAVNQIMVAGVNQAVGEALAFAESMELPLDKVIDVVGGGAAGNWFLTHRGPTMVNSEFPLGFKLSLHLKDLEICQQMAAKRGAQLPLVEMTLIQYRRLLAAGYGDEDISTLFRLKRDLFAPNR